MSDFIQFPQTLFEWAGLFAVAVAGIFGSFNIFDRTMNSHRKRKDGIENGLIDVMQKKIDLQDKEISNQTKLIGELRQIVTEVKAENDLLTKIVVKALRKDSEAILNAIQEAGNRAATGTTQQIDIPEAPLPDVPNK